MTSWTKANRRIWTRAACAAAMVAAAGAVAVPAEASAAPRAATAGPAAGARGAVGAWVEVGAEVAAATYCHVSYITTNQWPGGFVAVVTMENLSGAAWPTWTLTFTYPGDQKVSGGGGITVRQVGENVTVTPAAGFNGGVPSGGMLSFSLQGTWTRNDAAPTVFAINGVPCI